jgi:hypothetical protein
MNLTTEQKAQMYNDLLFRYQRLQEEVRLIKAQSINISDNDQRRIDLIEAEMRNVYAQTERLYR